MSTIRYTAGGDFDTFNSDFIGPEESRPFVDLRSSGGYFSASVFDGGYDGTRLVAVTASDGIFADFSDASNTYMVGGDKGDVLRGGRSDSTLIGGGGNDLLQGGAGADEFHGGVGHDTVSYDNATGAVSITIRGASGSEADGDTFSSIEAVVGSGFDDIIQSLNGAGTTVEGGRGADQMREVAVVSYAHSFPGVTVDLTATRAGEILSFHGGDAEGDTASFDVFAPSGRFGVIGSLVEDTLSAAADYGTYLNGNGGLDTITGNRMNDTIVVNGHWAAVDGGGGSDRLIVGGYSGSLIVADAGSIANIERIVGRGGIQLDLSEQTGTVGTIRISGSENGVIGTQGEDKIIGGTGDDLIAGGGGADQLRGGAGADTFAYRDAEDFGSVGTERILDFAGHGSESDRIDLSALGVTGIQDGGFVASGDAQLRVFAGANGFSVLAFDLDGDGMKDAALRVKSDAPLTAADFVFAHPPLANAFTASAALEHTGHQRFAELFHPFSHDVIA